MPHKTQSPVLTAFGRELKKIGKHDLHAVFISAPAMTSLRKIADMVGFDEYPAEGERKDAYLNKLWPYILEYEGETAIDS